jgi:CubicO group peptidase (beta-lactamase class C family)
VQAQVPGFSSREAVWLGARGCVLDGATGSGNAVSGNAVSGNAVLPAPVSASPPAARANQAWPAGDLAPTPGSAPKLDDVFTRAFAGGQGAGLQNTRGLLVIHKGQLVREQYAPGFDANSRLHGWSMTKTLAAMVVLKQLADQGIALDTPVVDVYPADKRPAWWAQWKADDRSKITVADMLFMRDGLGNTEGYQPWSDVPRLLWGGSDVPVYAAKASAQAPAGTRWRYVSATTNLLTHALLARSGLDGPKWVNAITQPIGANSMVVETDAPGTPVMSSYGWASARDWARLGWLLMNDGVWRVPGSEADKWEEKRVLPAGTFKQMVAPSLPSGAGSSYGMQVWLQGREESQCNAASGVPADAVSMGGHWGQVVVMVPSRDLIVVRLGWTMRSGLFDRCALVRDVIQAVGG